VYYQELFYVFKWKTAQALYVTAFIEGKTFIFILWFFIIIPVYHWIVAGIPLVVRVPQFEKRWSSAYRALHCTIGSRVQTRSRAMQHDFLRKGRVFPTFQREVLIPFPGCRLHSYPAHFSSEDGGSVLDRNAGNTDSFSAVPASENRISIKECAWHNSFHYQFIDIPCLTSVLTSPLSSRLAPSPVLGRWRVNQADTLLCQNV
jgi:hypothetical protein